MDISENFGIRLRDDEVKKILANHLATLGYIVDPKHIGIVPLTNSKVEFVMRQFQKVEK